MSFSLYLWRKARLKVHLLVPYSMLSSWIKGSRDAHFVWKKNGQKMANCVNEQTHMLSNGQVHLLSWVKDAVAQDSEYTCLLISESGSKASTSSITVEGSNSQETWSRKFASWRSVIGQHEKLLENWKNTLDSCNKSGTA